MGNVYELSVTFDTCTAESSLNLDFEWGRIISHTNDVACVLELVVEALCERGPPIVREDIYDVFEEPHCVPRPFIEVTSNGDVEGCSRWFGSHSSIIIHPIQPLHFQYYMM